MIETIRKIATSSTYPKSELGTLFHLVIPLFDNLGWKIGMVENMVFEDKTKTNRRIDIKFRANSKSFLLEAKRSDKKLDYKDLEQLATYLNSDEKTDIGILTNGIEYWIVDNLQNGLENKVIYNFSIQTISQCDLEVLEYFRFPLNRFEKLRKKIEVVEGQLLLEEIECNPILDIPEKSHLIDWDNFSKLDAPRGRGAEIFFQKVELFLSEMDKRGVDLENLYRNFHQVFEFDKTKYPHKTSQKFGVDINTNFSNKEKERLLEKMAKFAKQHLQKESMEHILLNS